MHTKPQVRKLWRQWESFTRSGVKLKDVHFSTNHIILIWVSILAILYLFVWTSHQHQGVLDDEDASQNPYQIDTDFWRGRHVIFCISPGRSGSKYLRNVLDAANVISRHEPEPKMTGVYLQQVILEGKREETFDQRARLKLEAIKKMLEGTPPNVAYAETSHMFVKTFSDVLLDKLGNVAKVSVVFLHRPAKDTVWSQLRLGWFSDGHSGKNMWYYDVNDVHESEQQMSFKTNSSSAIDSLIGYNADVLQRGVELEREINRRRKKGEWKHVRVFESFLSSISGTKQDGVLKLFRRLGLEADMDKLKLLNAQDTNSRDVKKDRYSMKSSPKDVEKRLDYLSDKLPLLKQVMYN